MSPEAAVQELPLHGLKVVELAQIVSGPYCSRLLADAGAEVIKVEGLQGDPSRRRGPFADDIPDPNASGLFLYLNANKMGITLDLGSSLGMKLFRSLLEDADVLVENNPPRDMEALDLQFPSLHREYPRLILTSVTPFGQTGPYRDYRGDDLITSNMGGLAYATPGLPDEVLDPEREPPLRPATFAADFTAGISGAVATMLALMARERDGVGRHVDVSAQEALATTLTWDLATTSYLGLVKRRGSRLGYGLMPNAYFPCKDGYVVITAFTDEHWQGLVEIMGSPEWAENELFDNIPGRSDNWDALRLLILEWTVAHTGQEISDATQGRGIPCFPAYNVGQAISSEQVTARGFLRESDMGEGRRLGLPGIPFRFDDTPWPLRMPAPCLGQHTAQVLSSRLGYRGPVLARLKGLGAI